MKPNPTSSFALTPALTRTPPGKPSRTARRGPWSNRWHGMALGLLALASLSACGSKDAPQPSTQVAAKVGSEEISLHQINTALAQSNSRGATPEQVQVLSRNALEGLIDQQVAVEQAMVAKLDRDPEVMAQVDAARRGVLASAYVKQVVASLPKPDAQEASTYYAAHPELFSARRIYSVQEVVVPRSPEVLEQFTRMAAANQSMEDVVAWLKSRQISVNPATSIRAAEQIPLDLLPRMHTLKDGQNLVFTAPTAVTFLRLVASRTEPVSETLALPRITQYLGTQRTVEGVNARIKELRSKATVVYQGEFANAAPAIVPAAPASAPAIAATPSAGVSRTLEQGVAGLK